MKDISLISDEDLLKELEKRFEHTLFYGLKEKLANVGLDYAGNVDTVLGCIERLKFIILKENEWDKNEEA